jgi:drug/metabolite transporter (DMT)-like permease
VTRGNLISVLICLLGISLFYTPGQPMDWRGSALALVSGVTYAAYILMLAHFRHREIRGFLLNFYIFSINSLVMLLVCGIGGMLTLPTSPGIWALCFFFAVVINVCSVYLFQWGTLVIGGQQAAILSTMEPITSVFVGILAFRETMDLRTIIGSVLVIIASILIVLSGKQEA